MKKISLFVLAFTLCFNTASAQKDAWNVNFYGQSSNFWSYNFIGSKFTIGKGIQFSANPGVSYDYFQIKNNGGKVYVDDGKLFGFKAKDLFRYLRYGVSVGWSPTISPFGVQAHFMYQFRRFNAVFDEETNELLKYKIHTARPGIDVTIKPFISMYEEYGWMPMLEIGTAYNFNFAGKAPFDNAKKQFNNGLTTSAGLGVVFGDEENIKFAIKLRAELDNYNLFNKDFSPDGISHPYEGIKSKHMIFYIAVSANF